MSIQTTASLYFAWPKFSNSPNVSECAPNSLKGSPSSASQLGLSAEASSARQDHQQTVSLIRNRRAEAGDPALVIALPRNQGADGDQQVYLYMLAENPSSQVFPHWSYFGTLKAQQW